MANAHDFIMTLPDVSDTYINQSVFVNSIIFIEI